MPHHPADVGGGPVNIARIHIVNILHGPVQGNDMTAVVPHHAFGFSGGPGSVQDVQRIGGGHRYTVVGLGRCHGFVPVHIATIDHTRRFLGALKNNAFPRPVFRLGYLDGLVQQRFIRNHPGHFDSAGGRNNHFRFGVVDPDGQLIGGKTTENH